MLSWSVVEHENPQYTRLADSLTMTSFAVVKDQKRDRLISWPRLQNLRMPDPLYTSLPNPGHFRKIEDKGESLLSGFYLDVENMFHNIRLPPHMVPLFLFKLVQYGHLPPSLQLTLKQHLGFKPSPETLLRPLQRSLPMGFKWAVFIAHNFVRSCYLEAFSAFLCTSDIFSRSQPPPKILELQNSTDTITLSSRLALVLHIIDDVNFVLVDWPNENAISLQRIVESILSCKTGCLSAAKSPLRWAVLNIMNYRFLGGSGISRKVFSVQSQKCWSDQSVPRFLHAQEISPRNVCVPPLAVCYGSALAADPCCLFCTERSTFFR